MAWYQLGSDYGYKPQREYVNGKNVSHVWYMSCKRKWHGLVEHVIFEKQRIFPCSMSISKILALLHNVCGVAIVIKI